MKIKILFFLLISVVGFSQKKKINEEYDYINNYYQLVYQAHFEYLNEDYQKMWWILKDHKEAVEYYPIIEKYLKTIFPEKKALL